MGPAKWIGSGATPMSALVLPLGVRSPSAYIVLLRLTFAFYIVYKSI